MSLILHSPKSLATAGAKVELVAKFLGVDLEFNRIPATEWKSPEHLKRHPLGKVPVLETPEGCLYESLAIIRYLARKTGKLYGGSAAETAQIDQWLEFTNTQLNPYLFGVVYVLLGYMPSTQEKYQESKKGLLEVLKIVDGHLSKNQFLGSKEISVADIVVAAQLRYLFTLVLDETARSTLPNLTKWFVKIMEHDVSKGFYGKTWLAQKEFSPDFDFAPKKKEQPKKQQAKKEQKPEQKKQEKPKKEKKEQQQQDVHPLIAAEKKKKNPLDELPKSTFNLDDFKRDFVNAENKPEALQRFWAAYDPAGWSIWKSDYELYEGQGKVGYLTCNLKNGFIRNLDHFRKYAFGTLGVYGDEGDLVIKGAWLWRGTEIPEEWKQHNAYDYFKFKKLDHTNEADRKLVEQYWLNVNDSNNLVEGRPIFEAKWFK